MNRKMLFKRISGILLALMIILGMAGCGNKGSKASTETLNIVTTETTRSEAVKTEEKTEAASVDDIDEDATEAGGKAEADEDKTEAGGKAEDVEDATEAGGKAEETEDVTEAGGKTEADEDNTEAGGKAEADEDKTEAGGKAEETELDRDGSYTTKDDVALYIHLYGELPQNFITKKEAKKLGWSGGSLEKFAPGKCIGGDYFGNYEGVLPDKGEYHECDIDTLGAKKRGAKRIIYSDDGRIYYTEDHYKNFELLYGEE